MTMSDPIADMLTRIRNANAAKHDTVDVSASKMKIAIAKILLDEGYIESYELVENGSFSNIHITLKYGDTKNDKSSGGSACNTMGCCTKTTKSCGKRQKTTGIIMNFTSGKKN